MAVLHARPDGARPVVGRSGSSAVATAAVSGLRVVGAGLLGTNAGIHAYLWNAGYRTIPTIGTLFLLDVIGASVLTLGVLGTPRRWLAPVAVLGALMELGTVGGLAVSTRHALFGFIESSQATLYWPSAWTEVAGAFVLATLAVFAYRSLRSRAAPSWW